MTGALKPYPAYRDSGLPWLGRVPKHWEVRRLSQMGRLSKGNGGSKEDETPVGIPCVRYGDLYTTHSYFIERTRSFVSKETSKNYTPIAFGDVLFAASGETVDEIGRSAVNLMRTAACCGGDVILFRPEGDTVASYMGYALDCRSSAAQKAAMGRGITVMHIYAGQLKRLPVPLPPIPEQAAIARYLDHVGARVDRYIGAKERLIALLKERKQAIIDRAVTRGLDPNAPMKPTGIAWIPEVPAHWRIAKLKRLSRMRSGEGITAETIRNTGAYRVYGGNGIRGYTDRFTHDGSFTLIGRQGALCGNVHLASGRFWASEHAVVASVNNSNDIRWFANLLQAMNLNQYSESAAQPGLAVEQIVNLYVPVPPKVEQEEIVRHLDREFDNLDTAIARARRQIILLREYRESLINDVVTGKLDVRKAQVDAVPEEEARREADRVP